MTILKRSVFILFTVALIMTSSLSQTKQTADAADLEMKIGRFAPTVLTADITKLNAKDQLALKKIVEAAKLLDPLFLRQVWSGNDSLEKKLLTDKTAVGRQLLHYFYINDGPCSTEPKNFITGSA